MSDVLNNQFFGQEISDTKNTPSATRQEACAWLRGKLSRKDHFVRSSDRSVSRPRFLKECRLFRLVIAIEGRPIEQFFNHV
ncbi:hypothetical protein L596_017109 [Steinernema carpocapsae]|uniref:Uncharacterized protein n=1 Tax=Steinernema carpocapsae TaxID=34508 RepID=A0A4U5N0J0_STECR|nr:hypothetical protein L596_017109 [Steinernema carpocapsae]